MTYTIMEKAQAEELVNKAVRLALQNGADEAAAVMNANVSSLSRFAVNRMTQNMERSSVDLALAVAVGKRECTLKGNPTDEESIKSLAKRCVENARLFSENEDHLPPVPPQPLRSVNGFDPEVASLEPKDKVQIISDICCMATGKGLTAYGTYRNVQKFYAVANSSGMNAYYPETIVGFSMTARTSDDTGSGREVRTENWLKNLNPREIADEAISRAVHSRQPRELAPGDYTVILTPTAVANYLAFMFWSLDARLAETGRSPLSRRNHKNTLIDEQVFGENITIRAVADDPHIPVCPFGAAFSFEGAAGQGLTTTLFSDGLPVENMDIVENGVLKNLFYSYYWAMQKNMAPKGMPTYMTMDGDNRSVDDLVSSTERGILISSLWYIRFVDQNTLLLTGLTRDGTFYIEDGKIQYPIKNFRFNESPIVSLKNVEALSQPQKRDVWQLKMMVPGMKVKDFTFTSVSDAI